MSTIFLRYFYRTEIPSGWQAHSSKTLATYLYSDGSKGKLTIVLIKLPNMSALMNHKDKLSYISLSLNSRTISIIVPISYWIYFLSF